MPSFNVVDEVSQSLVGVLQGALVGLNAAQAPSIGAAIYMLIRGLPGMSMAMIVYPHILPQRIAFRSYGGLFKAVVFGVIIAVIGCASGLRATGGALGVGRATRAAVRDSIVAVIIANYFMTWILYQA